MGQALEEARHLRYDLTEALADAFHLNFERDVLPPAESALMQSLVDALDLFIEPAAELLNPGCCLSDDCRRQHEFAGRIARIIEQSEDPDSQVSHVRDAAQAVLLAIPPDRERSALLVQRVRQWEARVDGLLNSQDRARKRASSRGRELVEAAERLHLDGGQYLLMPLCPQDIGLIDDLYILKEDPLHEDDLTWSSPVRWCTNRSGS